MIRRDPDTIACFGDRDDVIVPITNEIQQRRNAKGRRVHPKFVVECAGAEDDGPNVGVARGE